MRRVISALEYLKTRICVFDCTMKRALYDTENAYGVCGIFSSAADNMDRDGLRGAWRRSVTESGGAAALDDGDVEILLSVGDRLGSTDSENQRLNLEGARELLKRRLEEAEADYTQQGRLYRNCGLLCGMLTALLLL